MTEYAELARQLSGRINKSRGELETADLYYNSEYRPEAIGVATPEPMRELMSYVGWARVYIDAIEERLDVEGFRIAGQLEYIEQLMQWWQDNDLDEESSIAHLEALIYGRSFVTVAHPGDEESEFNHPLIRVESPLNMSAIRDPRTQKLIAAFRIYGEDGETARGTLYTPNETRLLVKKSDTTFGDWFIDTDYENPVIEHGLGDLPVEQLTNRARSRNRNGSSEINNDIRSNVDAACRLMMNMQSTAELIATPQRLLFGVSPEEIAGDGTPGEVFSAYVGHIMAIENDQAKAQQFSPGELRNYTDGMGELTRQMTSYTGLPPEYFGITSDNPSSADAIRMAETRLVQKAKRRQRHFGASWERIMRLAMKVMGQEVPEEWSRLETVWREPSTPTFAAKADAVQKLYNEGKGILNKEWSRIELGYSNEARRAMRDYDSRDSAQARLNSLLGEPPADDEDELAA